MEDIIIAGAGPVGLYTAGLLEKKYKVLVLEKQRSIGTKACSGLVSKRLGRLLKIPGDSIEHEIDGAVVHLPSGKEFRVEKKGLAWAIDRHVFDRELRERVGSRVVMGSAIRGFKAGPDKVDVRAGKGYSARVLLGCDGANSRVRELCGQRPGEILTGITATEDRPDSSGMVDVWIDKRVVKDGFLWKIPRGRRIEYGMLGSNVSFRALEDFFRIKKCRQEAGAIPLGLIKTCFDRCLLIGDSACQVKPWSGGGLVYGMLAAGEAKKALDTCFRSGDFSRGSLAVYEKGWKKILEKNIKRGMFLRKVYSRLGNRSLELLLNRYAEKRAGKLDMDFPLPDKLELQAVVDKAG